MNFKDKFIVLMCVVIFGINFVAVKIGVSEFSPQLMNGLRFFLASMLLLPFCEFPSKEDFKQILKLSLVLGIGDFFLFLIAMKHLDASVASVLVQSCVPFAILLAWFIYKEPFGIYRWTGIFISLIGVFVLAEEPSMKVSWPFLMMLATGLAIAYSNFIVKKITKTDRVSINGWCCLFMGILLMSLSLALEENHLYQIGAATWRGWIGVIYPAVFSSCTAFTFWYLLVSRNDISKVAPYSLLVPVSGFFAGVFLLDEVVTPHKAVGCLLVVGGVAIIEIRQYLKKEVAKRIPEVVREEYNLR
ncbi:MAG: EamA family transporter [Alphaproteobacteria bacterium]|nr:EamA family transporter [Alphaproteobacteria bacterium]